MERVPKVSICLPNLNTRPFLAERFQSIFDQTLTDWELIVCDSFSDDGSWEYIQELAAKEPRMRIYQTPRRGIYIGFNDCIERARGEFVYIATSDDTMKPECLEKMVAALEANPDCGIAQCELEIIDADGKPLPEGDQWRGFGLGSYDQDLVLKKNKRLAPHDGLLYTALGTVYTSVTQLVIRRGVFERVGLFEQRWKGSGDFEWEMRAALVESCVFVPGRLATWRRHATQETQETRTVEIRLRMAAMARAAFERAKGFAGGKLDHIRIEEFMYFLERDVVELGHDTAGSRFNKIGYILKQSMQRPRLTGVFLVSRLGGKRWNDALRFDRLRGLLAAYGVPTPMVEGKE